MYEALMDSEKHSQFTGAMATISREVGGEFSAYDGALSGSILELVPDAKIVQSWRGSDDGWVAGHYSTATFSLEAMDGGTRLTFVQTGVPEQSFEQRLRRDCPAGQPFLSVMLTREGVRISDSS